MAEVRPTPSYGSSDTNRADAVARRISWGAIFAGTITAVGVSILLGLLGVWGSATAVEPMTAGATPDVSTMGFTAGLFSALSVLLALFCGGWVAGRLAGVPSGTDGMLHGWLTWGLTMVVFFWLVTSAATSVVGGAFGAIGGVAQLAGQGASAAGSAATQAGDDVSLSSLPAPIRNVLGQIEGQLRGAAQANGVQLPQDRQELDALVQDLASAALQGNTDQLGSILSQRTGVSPEQANATIEQFQAEAQQTIDQAETQAREAAQATAEGVASGAIWGLFALLLAAIAAAVGGRIGIPTDHVAKQAL
ncbi:hypothetical protein [Marinivivus vitaminiproducens]|uniref:hypothetical protein n=1 Tax=Marinivivus vitaminiproducens TaxID=3035935 RepID=UPI0027A7EB9C|nr:hypothetical protein P4R82_23660 [Geminicoccaceae bacterium SCSIO 64248]